MWEEYGVDDECGGCCVYVEVVEFDCGVDEVCEYDVLVVDGVG